MKVLIKPKKVQLNEVEEEYVEAYCESNGVCVGSNSFDESADEDILF